MLVVIAANDRQWEELMSNPGTATCIRVEGPVEFEQYTTADAFINVREDAGNFDYSHFTKPVIINAVTDTLQSMKAPAHVLRINGWSGFLQRPVWEVAGSTNENIHVVLSSLNKKMSAVTDEPGLIAARIIAMIINEAYFAVGDKVSSKSEIDTAMKLGTNYPWGPFEWAGAIGLKNIAGLLQQLALTDNRYLPAPLLVTEANSTNT